MNGYEKYMDRQRMSDTGMARLVKLETERPPKVRKRVPQWVKYAGMAASLFLVVGLFALPILQGAQQQRAAGPNVTDGPAEELQFQEMPHYGFFVDESQYIGKRTPVEPEDAAELFGCAPDDFAGFLETVGLEKYDMGYYTVDMAGQGDDSYRFLMKGDYISPREKPENWDETSEISWEMWRGLSSFLPRNDVWLEIYEGHSYLSETDWNEVEPQAFQGHQVAAACDANSDYYAAAAFDVACNGKTYGVLYSAVTYGDCNAKEVVTQMVRYLTQSGLFIEDRGTAQVKTTGLYVMERGESDNPVMPRIHFDGESYTFAQSLLSSHLCRGGYEVANGRVTARCDEHHFVFDILDENTLRFVGSESSAPVSYKGEPQITDGAVFRWQEIVWGEEGSVQDYDTLDDLRASVDEKFLPYLPTTLMDHDEFSGYWRRNNAEYESVDVRWDKPWVIQGSYARFSYSGDIDVKWPLVAMGLPEVTDITDRENYDFRKHPGLQFPDGSQGYQGIYQKLYCPTFWAKDASLDLIESRIYQVDPGNEIDGYPEATTECRFQLLHDNNVLVNYRFHGMTAEEIWTVVRETIPGGSGNTAVEPTGVFYLEPAEGETLFYPYLNLSGNGNTFSWRRGEESSRSGSYAVADGKVRCHRSGKIYVFEAVDEDTLRYVGAESDALDYLDADLVTRTLPDGAVLRRNDAQLGALDAALRENGSTWLWTTPEHDMEVVHHPEPTHHVEATHHPEPTHHVEEAHHSNSHH